MYLYATDYDGTVTYHGVTPEFLEALSRWKAAGHLFGVISGRPYSSIREAVVNDGLPIDFLIGNNGAVIADGEDRMLEVTGFSAETAAALIHRLAEESHRCYRLDTVRHFREWYRVPEIALSDGKLTVDGQAWDEITEITTDYPDYAATLAAADRLGKEFADSVRPLLPGAFSIDFIPASVSKAIAVKRVTELLHVEPDRIFTTGDSHNDLDMLICQDFEGYAVENAMTAVKEAVGRTVADPLELLTRILGEDGKP